MSPPRVLVNADGGSFADEIPLLATTLGGLANPDRLDYRNANSRAIAQSEVARLLIVAGPGSGKSFLFLDRIRYWLSQHTTASVYVASFVRKLVKDLQADVDTKLSEDDQNRVTVTTLHSLARSLLERNNGTPTQPMASHIKVISGPWARVVWEDVLEFYSEHTLSSNSLRALEKQFHTEEFGSIDGWPELLSTYSELCRFYNAVGFADMIVLAREAIESNPELNLHSLWIIDEFQDFNRAEEHLIQSVTDTALGVLIAGDDEQALYQQLKASHPAIIISYYTGTEYANAMLPYCSRCSYYVCLAASAFIAGDRDTGSIEKIYLPLTEDEYASKVQIIATAAPTSAVDYVAKFLRENETALAEHIARMESGDETDPFLLILTPEKTARFYQTGGAQEQLRQLVARWAIGKPGHSADYWKLVHYCTAAWSPDDNFTFRKVLDYEGVSATTVHGFVVEALDRGCRLCEVRDDAVQNVVHQCDAIAAIIDSTDLTVAEKVTQAAARISVSDQQQVTTELEAEPISLLGRTMGDESEEAIETAGAASAVEMMTLVGSKGLSAHHVIVIGCDNVNFGHTGRLAFFVALTRARSSLHLITALKAGGAKAAHPFILELPESCCEYRVHKKTGSPEMLADRRAFKQKLAQWVRFTGRR